MAIENSMEKVRTSWEIPIRPNIRPDDDGQIPFRPNDDMHVPIRPNTPVRVPPFPKR